jgi:hypothetical protein
MSKYLHGPPKFSRGPPVGDRWSSDSGQNATTTVAKWKVIYHGQRWTTWFVCKEDVKLSNINRQLSAVCGQKGPAYSTVFNWVRILAVARRLHRKA